MRTSNYLTLIGFCLATASTASATDFDAAAYHEENCSRCHGTEVYTREDRRVQSLESLQTQVARCDANLGTQLFPDDMALLVDHLNTNFYKFAK